jgi:hypothetical protein
MKFVMTSKKANPLSRKSPSPSTRDNHDDVDGHDKSDDVHDEREAMNKTFRLASSDSMMNMFGADDIENASPIKLIRSMLKRIGATAPTTATDVKNKVRSKIQLPDASALAVPNKSATPSLKLDVQFIEGKKDIRLSPLLRLRQNFESPPVSNSSGKRRVSTNSSSSSKLNITDQDLRDREICTNQIYSDICQESKDFGVDCDTFNDYCEHDGPTCDDTLVDATEAEGDVMYSSNKSSHWNIFRMFNCARVSLPVSDEPAV